MGTKLTNEENLKLQHNTIWMVWEKQIRHEKPEKKRKRERWKAYFKDGSGPCLDILLRPCGKRKIIVVQNNIYDKYGSQKKLFQPKTLLRPFPPIYLFIWLHHVPCGNLPQQEIELVPPALEVQGLNHWTAREVLLPLFIFASQLPNSVFLKVTADKAYQKRQNTCLKSDFLATCYIYQIWR